MADQSLASGQSDSELGSVVRVDVGIASIGRATLLRTLGSLVACKCPPGVAMRVVVADDSGTNEVATLLGESPVSYAAVHIVPCGMRNIAAARNACLDAADAEYLIFVDDDEWVAADWLEQMLAQARACHVDAIFGRVVSIFPDQTPKWMSTAAFVRDDGNHGHRVASGRTGNTLLRLATVRRLGLRFREEFGQTGGEDTDFFTRFGAAGAVMVVSTQAVVYESVPPSRATVSYLRLRYIGSGQSYAAQTVTRLSLADRGLFYLSAFFKALISLTFAVAAVGFRRDVAAKFALKGCMNLGKLRHGLGMLPPAIY